GGRRDRQRRRVDFNIAIRGAGANAGGRIQRDTASRRDIRRRRVSPVGGVVDRPPHWYPA
ncbi:MAG: hypothetical protein U5O39_08400, partial [Gammaproteobacteria bacterium]|nr:hypothetical protein [Gammaproteobacteria bacterium]